MSHLVCHMGKYTRGNVVGLQKHNQRENKNYGNENIDLSKSHLNYDLQNQESIKYLNKIDQIIKENRTSDKAVRKDAIVYVDTVVGSDKKFFKKLSPEDTRRFFEKVYEYLQNKVGEKNVVSAVVHMDETKGIGGSPHMHFSFVPMNEDGTLSAKKKINRNFLREIQDEFPRYMKGYGFNVERGMENSTKKHLEPLEFKKQELKKDIENAKQEQERFEKKYSNFKESIKTRAENLQKTSESLSKLEEHTKGVLGKLDKIQVKKGLFGDKLTISEQDYSILVSLAKAGEGKLIENLQLRSKIGDLTQKLSKLDAINNEFQRLKGIELKHFELQRKYRNLNISFERVEKAINNLDLVEPVNKEIQSVKIAEMSISKSFDIER
ncbi:MobV family relaxase [Clostridium saccharoperbutylacetonicum]|uniref:MobV family relaxase n=3 Tax=Clostridium saccharoperbutylacetonicum TaxID=36745 RepID=UPI000983EEB5|nr:MobV family relaxase [Clostridium saccharoperbutylacetonicum]AQR98267.1 plasmid recombination enzyme [Clostridium saccharoperbutylacetonicum]